MASASARSYQMQRSVASRLGGALRTGLFTREAGMWRVPVQSGFTLFGQAPYAVTTVMLLVGLAAAVITWRRRHRGPTRSVRV